MDRDSVGAYNILRLYGQGSGKEIIWNQSRLHMY